MRTGEKRKRLPNWAIGLILVFFLAVASVYAFTKSVPWADKYEVQAVFETAGNIRPNSPVRIAGVNVGKVTSIEHLSDDDSADLSVQAGGAPPDEGNPATATVVTMELDDSALPLREDATLKLRPRLFLEGNLFVELKPGSPNSEEVDDGHVFPASQTSIAVQIDQVFTTLQGDVRSDLQTLLDQLGTAFDEGGAEGFREIYDTSPGAFRYSSVVNEAFLGTEEHDLSELIVNLDDTVEALDKGGEVQDLVTNLRTVLGSFAAESDALEDAIAELPGVLEAGRPALASLNAALPNVRAFAREALPGVRSTPATLDAATPLLSQIRGLVSEDELRGLTADLRPTIPRLASLTRNTIPFLRQGRKLSSCFNEVIIPWSNMSVDDPESPAVVEGQPAKVFEELGYGLVGIGGESRSGDANGPYIRVMAGGGPNTVTIPSSFQETDTSPVQDAVGVTSAPLLGAIPSLEDSSKTPFRPDVRCETQEQPDLEASTLDLGSLNSTSAMPRLAGSPDLANAAESLSEIQAALTKAQEDGQGKRTKNLLERSENLSDDLAGVMADQLGWSDLFDLDGDAK